MWRLYQRVSLGIDGIQGSRNSFDCRKCLYFLNSTKDGPGNCQPDIMLSTRHKFTGDRNNKLYRRWPYLVHPSVLRSKTIRAITIFDVPKQNYSTNIKYQQKRNNYGEFDRRETHIYKERKAKTPIRNRYDFVIFGASGFSGQFVVEELVRVVEKESFTMAVADMTEEKLQKVLDKASFYTGRNLQKIPRIIADTANEDSIIEMCKRAKVILNCVGPYLLHGEQVVKACVENGTHHLDISGEPLYLERMQLLYHKRARRSGVYVIGGCGVLNAPCDLGVHLTKHHFQGDLNSIDCYKQFFSGPKGFCINVTTLDSAFCGLSRLEELKHHRQILNIDPLPVGPYKNPSKKVGFSSDVDMWYVHSPTSEKSIVNRSLSYDYKINREKLVSVYICTSTFFNMLLTYLHGYFLLIFGRFRSASKFILKYPQMFTYGLFRRGGSSREQLAASSFAITFVGKGWKNSPEDHTTHKTPPDQTIITRISGPDIAYMSTAISLVQCGVTLLKETENLPNDGGVYTVATAFSNTNLVNRFHEHNVRFEVVSTTQPESRTNKTGSIDILETD